MLTKLKLYYYKLWGWLDDITPGDHLAAEVVYGIIFIGLVLVVGAVYALVRYVIGA